MGESTIGCCWHKVRSEGHYLITLSIPLGHTWAAGGVMASYPQARAVVDDFGTLVIVRGWR